MRLQEKRSGYKRREEKRLQEKDESVTREERSGYKRRYKWLQNKREAVTFDGAGVWNGVIHMESLMQCLDLAQYQLTDNFRDYRKKNQPTN